MPARALNRLLSRVFEAAGLQIWLAGKVSEFIVSIVTRVSRVTVALAALMLACKAVNQIQLGSLESFGCVHEYVQQQRGRERERGRVSSP